MNNSNAHVLFYSENCPHSREFINLINNTRYGSVFRRCCVERMAKIPNGIFEVPTIIVPGYNVPLSGDNVFKWFKQVAGEMPSMRNSTTRESMEPKRVTPPVPPRRPPPDTRVSKQQTQPATNREPTSVGGHSSPETNNSEEPSPFGLELSAGFSDIYSYIDDDAGKPLVHAFEYIDGSNPLIKSENTTTGDISTTSSRSGGNTRDDKSNQFNKKYEDFMMNRNSDPVCNNSSNVRQI